MNRLFPSLFYNLNLYQKIAFFCAFFPFLIGTIVFVGWLLTKQIIFALFGYFAVLIGISCFILGCVFLFLGVLRSRSQGTSSKVKTAVLFFMLVLNFPIASVYAFVFFNYMTSYRVTIDNQSSTSVESFILKDPGGKSYEMGTIPPHEVVQRKIAFRGEGGVTYHFNIQSRSYDGDLIGYVTGGMGGKVSLSISPDLKIQVDQKVWE